MAQEPLEVDSERLLAAANRLLAAADEIPTPPAPRSVTGSDPLSAAIAAQAVKVEAPVADGLPAIKSDASQDADKVAKSAKAYESTDQRLGDDINKRTFPKRNGQRHNGVQLVDWKQGPDQPPPPPARGLPPEGVRPPVAGNLTERPASRPSERAMGGMSLWDENGGEWRYDPGSDKWHNPHFDYNPHDSKFSKWQNIQIGELPPHTDEAAPPRSGSRAPARAPTAPPEPPPSAEPRAPVDPPAPRSAPPRPGFGGFGGGSFGGGGGGPTLPGQHGSIEEPTL